VEWWLAILRGDGYVDACCQQCHNERLFQHCRPRECGSDGPSDATACSYILLLSNVPVTDAKANSHALHIAPALDPSPTSGFGLGLGWVWIGFGLGLDWVWIGFVDWVWVGFGLGLDWVWIGFGLGLDWEAPGILDSTRHG
jgi:hypothetical protein